MTAPTLRPSHPVGRSSALLLLSVTFHGALLAALALHMPVAKPAADSSIIEVALVAPPAVRVRPSDAPRARTEAHRPRVVGPGAPALRYAAAAVAPTGDAEDAVDLFGPVFADGLWPRPVKVGHAPCDAAALERDPSCQRDLMLIGLASDAAARSKAGP